MKWKALLLLPLVASLMGACASSSRSTTASGTASSSGNSTTENVLRQIRESYQATPLLTMEGEMKISGVPANVWFDALLRRQDSMKIVLTGPFGVTLGAMSATHDHFIFYNADQGEAIEGTPDRETFTKLTSISLDYNELMALLRGEIPHLPEPNSYTARESDGYLVYTTTKGTMTEEIMVDPSVLAVKRYVRYNGADPAARSIELAIDYDRFKMLAGRQLARKATVNIDNGRQIINVTINNATEKINGSLALNIPAGVTRRRL